MFDLKSFIEEYLYAEQAFAYLKRETGYTIEEICDEFELSNADLHQYMSGEKTYRKGMDELYYDTVDRKRRKRFERIRRATI